MKMDELHEKIEEVLRKGDRAGALELLPQLRVLCRRINKLRTLSMKFPQCGLSPEMISKIGLSRYVVAVAVLAGHREEFARFA